MMNKIKKIIIGVVITTIVWFIVAGYLSYYTNAGRKLFIRSVIMDIQNHKEISERKIRIANKFCSQDNYSQCQTLYTLLSQHKELLPEAN